MTRVNEEARGKHVAESTAAQTLAEGAGAQTEEEPGEPSEYTTETSAEPEARPSARRPVVTGSALGTGRRKEAIARVRVTPGTGVIRTRAIASLRRPVPSALPVTTGRRAAGRASASEDDSVVYSETCSSAPSPGFASTSSASVCVDSATVLSSCFLI